VQSQHELDAEGRLHHAAALSMMVRRKEKARSTQAVEMGQVSQHSVSSDRSECALRVRSQ
jgi:hypothetical protein